MSPFLPSFSPSLDPFPHSSRALSPLSTAFTPNRPLTPLSTAFAQIHRGGGVARHSCLRTQRSVPAPTGSGCSTFLATLLLPAACALLISLAAFFRTRSLCFQWFAHSLRKSPGFYSPTAITTHAVAYMKCMNIRVAANLSVRNCYVSSPAPCVTWTRGAHQSIIATRSRATRSRFQVHG